MSLEKALNKLKKSGEINCTRCGQAINSTDWFSEWDDQTSGVHMYKSFHCHCGKKNWIKVDFLGSGDDRIFERNAKEINSTINAVREDD
ncbi:MAG TPA: hypothetical protein VJG49_00985 [Candidatus Nanoarchaeia archaeon]|nr:hypothetical protein [Candidatus Nanoarchaeia archaeon]